MLRFDQPPLLLLSLAAIPLALLGWRLLKGMDPVRRTVALLLRCSLVAAIAFMLAGPRMVREHDQLTVIGLLDVSGSIRRFANIPEGDDPAGASSVERLRTWFREATQTRAADDRFGLVVFDGRAVVLSVPERRDFADDHPQPTMVEGSNLADAIALGLAMFPADTARRLVLVTDGNQTVGDAVAAARQAAAAGGVPIDVVPIVYRVRNDARIVRVEAPPTAQPGQAVTVRMIIEATEPIAGQLTLTREGLPVDLNGDEPGTARVLRLPRGQSVHLAPVVLGETPVNRFEAHFEAVDPTADVLPENNRAEAFTVTPGKGKVLLVGAPGESWLAGALTAAGLPVESVEAAQVPDDLLSLQRYDLVILDNVPAHELSTPQQQLLARHVHDLGGGLIMVGGDRSFGAGGWNGTPIERVLPLELDPPSSLMLPTAALVLVLDKSGSMKRHVSGARASQQQVANEAAALAIESLRAETLVGVVVFDSRPSVHVPLQRLADAGRVADRVRGIVAEGGTDIGPALRQAASMLRDVDVDRKRIVCLSDGESPQQGLDELAAEMAASGIRLTTIAVGDDADEATLARLAEIGGGEFYAVRNPRTLPRVLVDSVQVLNEPLLKEGQFVPQVLPGASSLVAGMDGAPPLGGLVITAPREEPGVLIEMVHPDGEPLLAHWQAGLGRAAAFTSDARGTWTEQWLGWPGAATFWTQLARMTTRPAVDLQTELVAQVQGDRLELTFEAASGPEGFRNYLQVDGTVYTPEGRAVPVQLLQTAPGRYEASVPARGGGNYIVALSPREGARRLAPVIGGASKPLSAEYRRLESNTALLERIVELTRGRRLSIEAPREANLFDRTGMPSSISALPAWRTWLWIAMALLLLDVACRRLAWDSRRVRMALAAAMARVGTQRQREAAAATLASLRAVSERSGTRSQQRRPAPRTWSARAAASDDRLTVVEDRRGERAPVTEQPAGDPVESPGKHVADAAKVDAALDLLLGRTSKEKRPPGAAPQPPRQGPAGEDEQKDVTGSLLAAKRRAREEQARRIERGE